MAQCGFKHSVFLSCEGNVYSCGRNNYGQLGYDHSSNIPKQIDNLPKIRKVSCGNYFTICIDEEGILWSFGQNKNGQLGIGSTINQYTPKQIEGIPSIHTISCGSSHTLCITAGTNEIWSFGSNKRGELCQNKTGDFQLIPKQTTYKNIIFINAGREISFFQDENKNIYGCGHNKYGQLGIESNNKKVVEPIQIKLPKIAGNIINICTGGIFSIFLDDNGYVYSSGSNSRGQLGLGHNRNENKHKRIKNLPKIKEISSGWYHSLLLDENNNLWTFGNNGHGELGLGNTENQNNPQQIKTIQNIQQISNGFGYYHSLIKDINGKIYVFGYNEDGQLGIGENTKMINSQPIEMNSDYFNYWGNFKQNKSLNNEFEIKCISSIMNWKEYETNKINKIHFRMNNIKKSQNSSLISDFNQQYPKNSFVSWSETNEFLQKRLKETKILYDENKKKKSQAFDHVCLLENELNEIQLRMKEIQENLLPNAKKECENIKIIEKTYSNLKQLCKDSFIFSENEKLMNYQIFDLFQVKNFCDFDENDMLKVLWKMDLIQHQDLFKENHIFGKDLLLFEDTAWCDFGLDYIDVCCLSYFKDLMICSDYCKFLTDSDDYDDCFICLHNTPEKTVYLLQEYDINLDKELILQQGWTIPLLCYAKSLKSLNVNSFSEEGKLIIEQFKKWKAIHQKHLDFLSTGLLNTN